ncbi:hypothetical protein [Kitasatospora paranensis]|uniref:Hemerythrin-like domain-containing protein n=1 Tax=Kitasatospora paranensis TaxID=258053 RepID=A0ABW2FNF3_9ACTN
MSTAPAAPRRRRTAVLRRLAGGLGRSGARTASDPVDPLLGPQEQAAALLAVLDAAVAEQPAADRAIAACGEPGPAPAALAEELGRLAVRYGRYAGWLQALPAGGELAGVRELAVRLVAYHQWMLHQSANLAFAPRPAPRAEDARHGLSGLGAPADRLRALRDSLTAGRPA